jgi:ParB family chromosome partitioning protein
MNDLLKKRMAATQQASELQVGNEAYETLFQVSPPISQPVIRDLPLDKLHPFDTADIGFKPYSSAKLQVFSEQLAAEGLFERIIVRKIPNGEDFEIIAGHNRTAAARLLGWPTISAEIVDADDERATSIAVATNLLRRQDLTIIERGKAYKALLESKNKNGQRNAFLEQSTSGDNRQKSDVQNESPTFGDNRQRYNARTLVAKFFGVTEYEIRKAIKLTQLIPKFQDIVENHPKQLNLACADLIADYEASSQDAFWEMCTIEGYFLKKATVQYIVKKCPPPAADRQQLFAAWREARAEAEQRRLAPPKKITFDRKQFAPYLDKLGSEQKLEELFLEFLRERVQ